MKRIYANFSSMLGANKAVAELKKMGYTNAHLDAVDDFHNEFSEEISVPGSSRAPSLSGLVLSSSAYVTQVGKAPLIAADPMVSGIGQYSEIADNTSTRLVVNVEDENVDEINHKLKEFGGIM